MNKKYIDFVPKPANKNNVAEKADEFPNEFAAQMVKTAQAAPQVRRPVRTMPVKRSAQAAGPKVQPRPQSSVNPEATAAKSKRVSAKMSMFGGMRKPAAKAAPKPAAKAPARVTPTDKVLSEAVKKAERPDKTLNIPRAHFVNTEKVTKRPLSKNVYQKKVVVPEEKPKGLVTIIQKPEKDSRVGMVVTILITIILGAAAGTVAFLLLPK